MTHGPRRSKPGASEVLWEVARDDGDLEAAVGELGRDGEAVDCPGVSAGLDWGGGSWAPVGAVCGGVLWPRRCEAAR